MLLPFLHLQAGLLQFAATPVFPLRTIADYLPIALKCGIITSVKVRDVIKMIEEDGWYLSRTRGSHRQYKHSIKPGLITIAGKPNHDLAKGTLYSILKQAGLKQ